MSGRGSARWAARLRCAAALGALCASPAVAQSTTATPPSSDPSELDPSAPLDPMPGLSVDWPTLGSTAEEPGKAAEAQQPEAKDGGQRKYVIQIDGLGNVGDP